MPRNRRGRQRKKRTGKATTATATTATATTEATVTATPAAGPRYAVPQAVVKSLRKELVGGVVPKELKEAHQEVVERMRDMADNAADDDAGDDGDGKADGSGWADDGGAGAVAMEVEGGKSWSRPGETRRQRKVRLQQEAVAKLKVAVARPELVDSADVYARDPHLLLHLKGYHNSVPVPVHWNATRKYLAGKRAADKIPYVLPPYIEATGVAQMRQAFVDSQESKSLRQLGRDRMRGKIGRMDMDYQVLHDAFFVHQTKPKLTGHGELYYENKELEVDHSAAKPGVYSQELMLALGMQPGGPPPWLINMQRYGPPPSYPGLKVPGVNAPLPPGGSYGYEPGQWGKPPVDIFGRPLYGNVFAPPEPEGPAPGAAIKGAARAWGELLDDEFDDDDDDDDESSSEYESYDDDDDDDAVNDDSGAGPAGGNVAHMDVVSAPAMDEPAPAVHERPLYTVLEQRSATVGAGSLMGSAHTYAIPVTDEAQLADPQFLAKHAAAAEAAGAMPAASSKVAGKSKVRVPDASNFKF
ncbi:SF3B2 protein [Thecamonas trahens ATCC 50062]|uniref:SF3B2 protein n=1 Tax=Thecamonas trahens ATCC 50062 TaxID=461836 RepID=A0A0L0DUA7_THETB|nr:SF3B2 protein [Thecamonas trahens ATCC 50062]KNC55782.1 SF3B2 protein [Thecamonas trahens ATCC 50062]|eukprot:XP_013752864.1 SF3B2 protein [Thecamonas trahens ATCC 50062]